MRLLCTSLSAGGGVRFQIYGNLWLKIYIVREKKIQFILLLFYYFFLVANNYYD